MTDDEELERAQRESLAGTLRTLTALSRIERIIQEAIETELEEHAARLEAGRDER